MGRDWIIDVLADLRKFARDNDLPMLHAQLDDALLIAQVEIGAPAPLSDRHPHHDQQLARAVKPGHSRSS